ncbi:hypothetical protein [Pseudomonas syringae]|uniref:hypothetical protein n=1 Tax=Pseudomonas syringae TaxID=317 RepID=UPI0007EE6987|nr:hypothetical protein [Pseudomonas syringae]OBS33019.1 hypothetical protein A9K81_20380 [Pseudomonas syringae pv. syringae]
MSEVREMRSKLAVSLALAYKDYEVYHDVTLGKFNTNIDIKAEKFTNGYYDTFYVIIETVEYTSKLYEEANRKLAMLSRALKRPVYLAVVLGDGNEMILDPKLRSRMSLPESTKVKYFISPDNDYTT